LHFPQIALNCSELKLHVMKSKLYTLVTLITVTALVSCAGSNDNEYIDKSIIPAGSVTSSTQNNDTIPNTTVTGNTTLIPGTTPVTIDPQNNVVNPASQTVIQTAKQTATAPGMNPPHGEPNHRCDIAVGAPLNSKPVPATTQPTTVSTQPATVSTQQPAVTMKEVTNTQKTAPGMNPPHGEPNHRCDIAVGAPLNSKPVPATTQPTTVSTQPATVSTQQPAVTMKEVTNTQKTAPGMNPPHGEPNHRCDIAVGAPLNSKPAAPAVAPLQSPKPPPLIAAPKSDSIKN
jgi:hypothetical protein